MKFLNIQNSPFNNTKGFTLIELIIVIVILSILGLMGADFISQAFKGFASTNNRTEIYDEGKIALFRLEREIRNAIPNALSLVSSTDLRLGMIDEVAMRPVFGSYTESIPSNSINDELAALPDNTIISIYNRSWSDFTDPIPGNRRLYMVAGASGTTMPLTSTILASSPQQRFYAVDKAIRYYLDGTTLRRSEIPVNAINVDFNTFPADNMGSPLARNLSNLQISYIPASLVRNAIVSIQFTITRGGENVSFHKEIHVRNVP